MAADAASPSRGGFVFKAALVSSVLTALVAVAFFVIGVGDGSVSSFNLGLWLTLLAVVGASLGGGWMLHARGKAKLAVAALAVTAVPGLIAALFILLLLVAQPRWN